MKVQTERLPKSLVALEIEPDTELVEKELDRAARRLAQKVTIPGFRKGKAPRFIVENYFGRDALLEEATDELINSAFKKALEQEGIEPVGRAQLERVEQEPFRFRVAVPVEPTITLADHRGIRLELESEDVTDEQVQRSLNALRDQHAVVKDLEDQRPAEPGDQLMVTMVTFVDGEAIDAPEEGKEPEEHTLVLDDDRLLPELYEGLLGIQSGESREIVAHLPADHPDERIRDKDVTFNVEVRSIQERELPDWEELPTLAEFDGDLEAMRADTRKRMVESAKDRARSKLLNTYIEQLLEQTEFDLPDALVDQQADTILHRSEHELQRYGITLEQYLQYKGQTHEQAIAELRPQAERDLKVSLALREVSRLEGLEVSDDEIDAEIERTLQDFKEDQRDMYRSMLQSQMRGQIANSALDRKLRDRIVTIATGIEPEAAQPAGAGQGELSQPDMASQRAVDASGVAQDDETGVAQDADAAGVQAQGE